MTIKIEITNKDQRSAWVQTCEDTAFQPEVELPPGDSRIVHIHSTKSVTIFEKTEHSEPTVKTDAIAEGDALCSATISVSHLSPEQQKLFRVGGTQLEFGYEHIRVRLNPEKLDRLRAFLETLHG